MKIDHVVVLVQNLDSAQADWQKLGFTITPGGVHAGGQSHNALVCFADGSYIELLAFLSPPEQHHWGRYNGFWGPIDFALATPNIADAVSQLKAQGLDYSEIYDGGRQRPDGVQLRWRGAFPLSQDIGLPFLIEDVTPRTLRVPMGDNTLHANGANGIAQVRVGVPSLEAAQDDFTAVFGEPDEQPGTAIYRLEGSQVYLTQPAAGSAEASFIAKRGAGPVAVTIAAAIPVVIKPAALQSQGS